MRVKLVFCIVVLAFLLISRAADAATYTWVGGTGTWITPANWQIAGVTATTYPGQSATTDVVVFNSTGMISTITITLGAPVTVASVSYTNSSAFDIIVALSSPLSVTGAITTNCTSTGAATFTGSGTLTGGSLSITKGKLNLSNPAFIFTAVISGATTISAGATLACTGQYNTTANPGQDSHLSTGSLTATGALFIIGTWEYSLNSSSSTISGGLTLTGGTMDFEGTGTTTISGAVALTSNNTGQSIMGNSSQGSTETVTFAAGATITYSGTTAGPYSYPAGIYNYYKMNMNGTSTTGVTLSTTTPGTYVYNLNTGTFTATYFTANFNQQSCTLSNAGTMNIGSSSIINLAQSSCSISNAGTFTANGGTNINLSQTSCAISNTATFYAGTSGSVCTVTLSGSSSKITNNSVFYLGSTSIIYPTGVSASITNTSPGIFILQSDANGSAAIGSLSTTASCTGTFNVERYFQGSSTYDNVKARWLGRNYRIISSAVHNSIQVNSNNVYGLNYILGNTAGLTTTANSATNAFITGCAGGSTSAGNPSSYLFRESYTPANETFIDGNFIGITNITNSSTTGTLTGSDGGTYSLPVGNGVLFFFRGKASNWSTRTVFPYIAPENVTLTATGLINTGSVTVADWYSPSLGVLGFTGAGVTGNFQVRGFSMVGNPYPCTIDWCKAYAGTGITITNVNPTIYEYNPVTNQYDTFLATSSAGGTATGNASRYVMSGQGFFVQAGTGGSLVFTEAAKAANFQLTGNNLLMGAPPPQLVQQTLRLKLIIDSLNYNDIAICFNAGASAKYNPHEDSQYLPGLNAMESLSSFSADGIPLAVNSLSLPAQKPQVIKLDVTGKVTGRYTLQRTALDAIPSIYQIWLIDKYKKDSLDIRNNSAYVFNMDMHDTLSYGSNRFEIVIRQNPALGLHLLNFLASKTSTGSQLVWKTENEQNYTNFTVERSTDNGATFKVIGGFASSAIGTYSLPDKNPANGTDLYRLKMEDLNGQITNSGIVKLSFVTAGNIVNNISVYPNPSGSLINLAIDPGSSLTNATTLQIAGSLAGPVAASEGAPISYDIKIISITGAIIKIATSTSATWQDNVGGLPPGTYTIEVTRNNDKTMVGKSVFIKI